MHTNEDLTVPRDFKKHTLLPEIVDWDETSEHVTWGRTSKAKWDDNLAALLVPIGPLWMYLNWIALEHFDGSLIEAFQAFASRDGVQFAMQHFPRPSVAASLGYGAWVLGQAVLYACLPGAKCFGQRTPGGHLLSYTANGLMAWAVTHVLFFFGACVFGFWDPAIIATHWEGLWVAGNGYGLMLSIVALMKGYCSPSFSEDRKLSGRQDTSQLLGGSCS